MISRIKKLFNRKQVKVRRSQVVLEPAEILPAEILPAELDVREYILKYLRPMAVTITMPPLNRDTDAHAE